MIGDTSSFAARLLWNLPWLLRYPAWRVRELVRRATENVECPHLIILVANHFEPAYNEEPNQSGGLGVPLSESVQLSRLEEWCTKARAIGNEIRDHDGMPFRHTNFYPAEQYSRPVLERLAELQADGFGEVEIHLHHGVERPDSAENFRRVLTDFRNALVEEHRCLSRAVSGGPPMYAFVHGNWALANSANNQFCGVDDEMQILRDTGCYADFTLPSAPDRSQVPRLNAIYQCGRPIDHRMPHYSGPGLGIGERPSLPIIFTGPLVLDWRKMPVPRLESGALTGRSPIDLKRVDLWRNARISVAGRPEWVFAKLYCHGFFPEDQSAVIGSVMSRSLEKVLEFAGQTGRFKVHFATAREAFNMALAAVDGHSGDPGHYREYYLRSIMHETQTINCENVGSQSVSLGSMTNTPPAATSSNNGRGEPVSQQTGHPKARARRVLYLTDLRPADKFGSLEEQIFVLAKELRAVGGALIPVFGAPIGKETSEQYEAAGLSIEWLDLHTFNFKTVRHLMNFVRRYEIDLVHWNFYNPINPYVWTLSTLMPRLQHCITDHNSRIPSENSIAGPLKRLLKKALLRPYGQVLCISDFVQSRLQKQDVWPNLSRCTYFINTERFRPDPQAGAEFRKRLGLETPRKFVILFVGKLTRWKGGEVAIKALAKLPESAVLIVVGDGESLPAMRQLAERFDINHRVQFLGAQRNVEPYMQAADCFLCPSVWEEAVGLVNLEALACGLPVVASRIGGIPEIIGDGRNGLLFAPEDHHQLAERLDYLMKNPERLKQMGQSARAAAVEKFSIERRVPDYLDLYSSN